MRRGAKPLAWGALIVGIAAVLVLTAWQGFGTVAEAFSALGPGFLLLLLLVVPHLVFAAWSWQQLFRPGTGPRFGEAVRAIWVALSVDTLVPLASVGGEIVKVRLVMLSRVTPGVSAVDAVASVVADKTVQAISVVLWALTGAVTLVLLQTGDELVVPVLLGAGVLTLGVAGFIAVQLAGTAGRLARRVSRRGGFGIGDSPANGRDSSATPAISMQHLRGSLPRLGPARPGGVAALSGAGRADPGGLADRPLSGPAGRFPGGPGAEEPGRCPARRRLLHPWGLGPAGRRIHPSGRASSAWPPMRLWRWP